MNHQKLQCYQKLIKVVKDVQTYMPSAPRGQAELFDQLKRAMSSSVLNLVEGNGRLTPKDRRRFFIISAASVCEISAAIELIGIFHPECSRNLSPLQQELTIIYAMIWKMR